MQRKRASVGRCQSCKVPMLPGTCHVPLFDALLLDWTRITIAMLGASLPHHYLLLSLVTIGASAFDLPPALFFVAPKITKSSTSASSRDALRSSLHEVESFPSAFPSASCTNTRRATTASRRDALRQVLVAGSAVLSATEWSPQPGNAACLPGDKSLDCIGVYKVPLDDRILPYVGSPEMLKTYAPDLRWVEPFPYPKSYKDALTKLEESKDRFERIVVASIRAGKLEDAGVELLDITPAVTVAGRVILSELSGAPRRSNDWTSVPSTSGDSGKGGVDLSLRALRAEDVLLDLTVALGQTDILIGQALNGQLGALTPAQIQILAACTEISSLLDTLISVLPKQI